MWQTLRDGSWLTPARIRAVAILSAAATLLSLLYLFGTATGTLDRFGRPLGTDFSNVWTAGSMALAGDEAAAWDWAAHYKVQQAAHGDVNVPFYGWHYPPPFLMLAALLALLPYKAALILWQASTLTAAAFLVRKILPAPGVLPTTLAAPVVFICLAHGHNGFLTAALLGGGLLLLDRRPIAAGLLLGCLIYKPQFALLIPPLLIVGGHWRAFAGASLSAGGLVALTLALWGWPVWQAFADSLPLTSQIVIEQGSTGWAKIQSPFAMIRMWGGGIAPAYAFQAAATLLSVCAALWLARRANPAVRNAGAMAAAMLSTPYVLDYDFVVLGIGAVFIAADARARGFLSWEKSALAFIWAAPLFARQSAEFALIPVGQAAAIALLLIAIRRGVVLDGAAQGLRSLPFRRSRGASAR
jgi:hypothetical protein